MTEATLISLIVILSAGYIYIRLKSPKDCGGGECGCRRKDEFLRGERLKDFSRMIKNNDFDFLLTNAEVEELDK